MKLAFNITVILLFTHFAYAAIAFSQQSQEITEEAINKEAKCDFSKYKPLMISHALLNAVVKKVEPKISPGIYVKGKVKVKILVDRKGDVVRFCVVSGHPLLRASAVKAATEWKFKENFGFSKNTKIKHKYIQTYLNFNYQ